MGSNQLAKSKLDSHQGKSHNYNSNHPHAVSIRQGEWILPPPEAASTRREKWIKWPLTAIYRTRGRP
jgi:hypothetical protein